MLLWHLDIGHAAIPKSVNPQRIRENIDVFDIALASEEISAIASLDTGMRGGLDPEVCYTPGTF